jgi:hypothetical protein
MRLGLQSLPVGVGTVPATVAGNAVSSDDPIQIHGSARWEKTGHSHEKVCFMTPPTCRDH